MVRESSSGLVIIEKGKQRERLGKSGAEVGLRRRADHIMDGGKGVVVIVGPERLPHFIQAFDQSKTRMGKLPRLSLAGDVIVQRREVVPRVVQQGVVG